MSGWPGKYAIGLTGNIATGKSVVRRMLEYLGAYGVDADALAHRAISKGAPGYKPVLDTFGGWIVGADGQIDRSKLGKVVFSDPQALALLEKITHPLVRQAVDLLVRRSKRKVVVVEAIKLLESPLRRKCDSIWVTYAPPEIQLSRLMEKRHMTRDIAWQRILAQASQEEKKAAADVVIENADTMRDVWKQVVEAWQQLDLPENQEPETPVRNKEEIRIERSRPRQAEEVAAFVKQWSGGARALSEENILEMFGDKAFLMVRQGTDLIGVAGWKVENLVARTDDIYLRSDAPLLESMKELTREIEQASYELVCEISLVFLAKENSHLDAAMQSLGYCRSSVQDLTVHAWQEAAAETMKDDAVMYFKQLRKDRVLQPF